VDPPNPRDICGIIRERFSSGRHMALQQAAVCVKGDCSLCVCHWQACSISQKPRIKRLLSYSIPSHTRLSSALIPQSNLHSCTTHTHTPGCTCCFMLESLVGLPFFKCHSNPITDRLLKVTLLFRFSFRDIQLCNSKVAAVHNNFTRIQISE